MRFCLLLLALLLLLPGCGGGNHFLPATPTTGAGRGRATFTLVWPARTRLIPQASNSIQVDISQGSTHIDAKLLARPVNGGTASVSFDLLPVGNLTATATAYPNADGTGTAQATASVPLTIQAGKNTDFRLTMDSTIDHLELSPANPTVAAGQKVTLTATAKDAAGSVVLITPAMLQWNASGAAASVDANGVVTGLSAGSATISVTEKESGKSTSVLVTVTGQSYNINGITYLPSNPQETLTATFTQPDGGVTVSSYKGYVLLNVTGVGQSNNQVYNDAFYLYTDSYAANPKNGENGGYYQLAFGTSPLSIFDAGNNAENFLVGSLPAYNPAHDYTFILDTKLTSPGQLHFGVSDGGFSDNTGAYTVKVTQLVPAP